MLWHSPGTPAGSASAPENQPTDWEKEVMKTFRQLQAAVLAVALLAMVFGMAGGVHAAPGVDPSSVTLNLPEGGSTTVAKTVHTPPIPPKPDVLILADTTFSMNDT